MLSIQKKELSTKKNTKTKNDTISSTVKKKDVTSSSGTASSALSKKKKKKSVDEPTKSTAENNVEKKRKSSASSTKNTTSKTPSSVKKTLTKKLSDERMKPLTTKNAENTEEVKKNNKPNKLKKKKSVEKLLKKQEPETDELEKVKNGEDKNVPASTTVIKQDATAIKPPAPPVGANKPPPVPIKPTGVRHQDSMGLYKKGYAAGRGLVVTKSSSEVMEKNQSGRPVFHLNLNDSTASFLGTSPGGGSGPSYLEMSSGLLPYHPQNKYNFKISLDDTNDISQTANMLKNYIFDEDDLWNTSRTESAHLQKYMEGEPQPDLLQAPFSLDGSITPNTEDTTNRSYGMPGRTSTRLSFLYNKNIGLLCKHCFSSTCDHMDKFNILATPKLQKVFNNNEQPPSTTSSNNDSVDGLTVHRQDNQIMDITNESMRLIDVADYQHHDTSSGEGTAFRQINMEYETLFETSTPNEDLTVYNPIQLPETSTNNTLNLSGSMLRYTPGIMNQNTPLQQARPNTNESLKYDSDYDDDSYLRACETSSVNNTFETLDINSGVLFYNIEQTEKQPTSSSSSPCTTADRNNNNNNYQSTQNNDNKKLRTRRLSKGMMPPDLPTVFEEKSAPNSAVYPSDEPLRNELVVSGSGLEDLLNAVTDNLANMLDDDKNEPDSLENSMYEEFKVKKDLKITIDQQICEDTNDVKPDGQPKIKMEDIFNSENDEAVVEEESTLTPVSKEALSFTEGETIIDSDKRACEPRQEKKQNENEEQEEENKNSVEDGYGENKNEEHDCQTPLEKQGIFKRIKDDDEEERYIEQLTEDQLQAWLQANRKYTFEKDHFHNSVIKDLNTDALDSDDKEVLEINTPEWVERSNELQHEIVEKPFQTEATSTKVDASTQSDIPPLSPPSQPSVNDYERTTSTAGSSDLPKTQGSYRQIDLLVLDRSRDQRLVQENAVFELAGVGDRMDVRDVDSGVHSINTDRSDAVAAVAAVAAPVSNEGRRYELVEEPLIEDDETAVLEAANEVLEVPLNLSPYSQHQDIDTDNREYMETRSTPNNDFFLPTINHNYKTSGPPPDAFYDRETFYENPFCNRLVLSNTSSLPYYSSPYNDRDLLHSPRDIVSPILEHHLKMAQYHKERVALLTPLYSRSSGMSQNRQPPPPVLQPRPPSYKMHQQPKRNYKRRFSAGSNKYYDNFIQTDYLNNLSEISPRTRPYVPHPPSYDRLQQNTYQRIPYYDETQMYDPIWERRRATAMQANYLQKARKVDTDHDTSLYLTAPYRSVYMRPNHNGGR